MVFYKSDSLNMTLKTEDIVHWSCILYIQERINEIYGSKMCAWDHGSLLQYNYFIYVFMWFSIKHARALFFFFFEPGSVGGINENE
jgi:hypothetical protein